MKNKQKGFIVPVLLGVLIILLGGAYYILKEKKTELPLAEIISESEKSILFTLKYNWQTIQEDIPFRPGHPSTKDWLEPHAVQFVGNNNMLINFEDGYVSNIALVNISFPEGQFNIVKTWENKGLFTPEEWQEIINTYGNNSYPLNTYTISIVRGTEIVSFPELTKVPESVFVKNYPAVSSTYTYANHGFTIELPKGFVPKEYEAEGGPYIIIPMPTGGLSYVTDASFWEKANLPEFKFLREEKIGETTFKMYEYSGHIIYWFKRGNVGYEFQGENDTKLRELMKTFRFVGWAQKIKNSQILPKKDINIAHI